MNENSFGGGLLVAIILIIVLMGGYFLYNNSNAPTNTPTIIRTPTTTPSTATSTSATTTAATTTRTITVSGENFTFTPDSIVVKKGDTVRLTFRNTAGSHDLRIEDYEIGTKVLAPGAQETLTFEADTAGTFAYYCSVGNHREMGMEGTLIVEE